MKAIGIVALILYGLSLLDSCSPGVVVRNSTQIPVRVVVTSHGHSDVVSPTPGESSTAEVEEGSYSAVAIVDAEWIAYAQQVRNYLNEQLANSDRLTGPQLLSVVQRLKEIAARMDQYRQAAGANAKCTGPVSQSSNGLVTISIGGNGALVATCK